MQTMEKSTIEDRLKKLNCHFTWALEEESITSFDSLWDHLISRIENCRKMAPDRPQKNTQYISGKCLQAYLHLSSLNKNSDPDKALKNIEELLTELEQMEKLTPNEKKAYEYILFANRAWTLHRSSAISDASKALDELDQKYPVSEIKTPEIEAHINGCKGFALSRFGLNKYDEATRCFSQAVEVLPANGFYWGQMAILLSKQGRQQRSNKFMTNTTHAFEKSIRFNESDGIVLAEYGRLSITRNEFVKAEELFRKAEEMDPESSRVLRFIGEYYSKKYKYEKNVKDSKKAIEYFQRALEIESSTFILHKLGKVYEDTGDHDREEALKNYDEALKYYDKAIEESSSNFSAKMDKVSALIKLNRKGEARRLLTQLIDGAVNDVEKSRAMLRMGEFLIEEDKIEDGYYHIRESIKLHPQGTFQKRAARKYIKYLRDELEKDDGENTVDTLCELGWSYCMLQEEELAWQYYIRAYHNNEHENSSETQKDHAASHILEINIKSKSIKEAGDWVKRTKKRNLQIRYYNEAAVLSTSKQDYFQACIELSEALKLGSLEAAVTLMRILIEHNENLREKDWWGFYRFCGRISVLCDTDSKKYFENDEDVQQSAFEIVKKKTPKYSIEERKTMIKPENEKNIAKLFPNAGKYLVSLHKKCISLAKEVLQSETEESSSHKLKYAITEVLVEARSLLDKSMAKFQKKNYPELKSHANYFFVPSDDVEKELQRQLKKKTGWNDFSSKFPELFKYLVEIQPGKNITWIKYLFAIRNTSQHQMDVSEYTLPLHDIEVNTEKKKSETHRVDLLKLAIESAENVEKITNRFYETMTGLR